MKDKDKLILVFNLYVGNIAGEDIAEYIHNYIEFMGGYFDDSIKVIVVPAMERINPVIYSVKELPEMFFEEIEKLGESLTKGDETSLKISAARLSVMMKDYKQEREGITW